MSSTDTHISREKAANHLNVSVRTIDRYIRKGFFEVKRFNRNVFITTPSFEQYYQDKVGSTPPVENDSNKSGEGVTADAIETIEVSESDASEAGSRMSGMNAGPSMSRHGHSYDLQPVAIYKELYDELKGKYEDQVKRLEGAHYRVGQLEAQVKNMVPLLEFKQERKRLSSLDQQYKADIKQAKVKVVRTRRLVESERFNKNVYIALVYGLLALQSIFWLVMQG
jgi:hypothetical protein